MLLASSIRIAEDGIELENNRVGKVRPHLPLYAIYIKWIALSVIIYYTFRNHL